MRATKLWKLAATILVAVSTLPAQQTKKPDPWEPMRYFEGHWKSTSTGEPGNGSGDRSYRFILNNRFIEGRNTAVYPPQEKNKSGERHEDIGIYSYDKSRKRFVLRQFHSEGFVNTYVQQETADPKKIVFESEAIENIPAGWKARETWIINTPDEFTERFELAEPGKDFALYSETKLRRQK